MIEARNLEKRFGTNQVLAGVSFRIEQGESVVIIGNAKLFVGELRRRFPQVEVIPFARLDLDRPDLRRSP